MSQDIRLMLMGVGSVFAVMLFILGLVGASIWLSNKQVSGDDACQDALTAADARFQLSESTTALVFDQWRADNLGDAHGVEYAKSGIQTNQQEIEALTTDYSELKEACK